MEVPAGRARRALRFERLSWTCTPAGTRERGRLAFGAKAGANAPDFLASPLPKSDAMLRPGAGDSGGALL